MRVAAGAACSGAPDHLHRFWAVDPDRCLVWNGAGGSGRFEDIPGRASVVAADPWRRLVVLDDGGAHQFDRSARRWFTREEGDVKRTNGPVLLAAGNACSGIWCVTAADRRLWRWSATDGRQSVASLPLPGTSRPLAVDLNRVAVVFDDGGRLALVGGRWMAMPNLLQDLSGMVRVRALHGFCFKTGQDVAPGEVLDMSETDARRLTLRGAVTPAPDAEPPSVERT